MKTFSSSTTNRRYATVAAVITAVLWFSDLASGCSPDVFFLFREEARAALDSLEAYAGPDDVLKRIVLLHNLGFHKDKESREKAERLLNANYPLNRMPPVVQAYAGSLQMIKISHWSIGGKVLRTINPLTKSPYSAARDGFRLISEASQRDTANLILHALRATAAVESAEHLPELFPIVFQELNLLEDRVGPADTAFTFLINLNWAKYHYKLAQTQKNKADLEPAINRIERARRLACTPVYSTWAAEWEKKITDLAAE